MILGTARVRPRWPTRRWEWGLSLRGTNMNRCMRAVASLMRRTTGGMAGARWRHRGLGIAAAVALALATLAGVPQASGAATCANPVACENLLPGTPQSV